MNDSFSEAKGKQEKNWQLKPIRTKQEVADILGITRARVYHCETKALKKLRKVLEEKYGCDPR